MAQKVTRLIDVAQHAGLSVATVSRHLNGHIQLPVDTVARIEGAIHELGYRPNPYARSLSRGRSDTIGLVIPDIANPYFALLASAVERAAGPHGLAVVLCVTLNQSEREHEYLQRLGRNHLDGLIFLTNHAADEALAKAINEASRRVVILDEDVKKARGPKIFGDNEQGGYLAGRHLLEAGHRRLAFIGGPEHLMSTQARLAGFRRALGEAPSAELTAHYFGDYSVENGRRSAGALLRAGEEITAVFATSDEIAIGALEVFAARNVRIPDDLSVIGFDGIAPFHLFNPPLTCIRQPVEELGRRAVELLASGLNGGRMRAGAQRLPVELVVRESVSAPRNGQGSGAKMILNAEDANRERMESK